MPKFIILFICIPIYINIDTYFSFSGPVALLCLPLRLLQGEALSLRLGHEEALSPRLAHPKASREIVKDWPTSMDSI